MKRSFFIFFITSLLLTPSLKAKTGCSVETMKRLVLKKAEQNLQDYLEDTLKDLNIKFHTFHVRMRLERRKDMPYQPAYAIVSSATILTDRSELRLNIRNPKAKGRYGDPELRDHATFNRIYVKHRYVRDSEGYIIKSLCQGVFYPHQFAWLVNKTAKHTLAHLNPEALATRVVIEL